MLGVEEILEILRSVPVPCCLFMSIVFLSVGIAPVPVTAVHEFTVHRMQHFDLHGVRYGSRSALVNMEARGEGAGMLNRKCVVVQWRNLTSEKFLDLIHRGAGAILVLLPPINHTIDKDVLDSWVALESELFQLEVSIPVYFVWEDGNLLELHEILTTTAEREKDSSVASLLFSVLCDYGYQMVTVGEVETKPTKDTAVTTMIGTLTGQGSMGQALPTVALLTHYDAMSLAPSLPYGMDSNASGAVALLEMVRLFSRLYSDPNHRPRFNLLFILSGGGKFNYFGTKGLLEDQLENSDPSLSSADYTLCLDTLSSTGSTDLYIHVSKPPKEGSKAYHLLHALNKSTELLSPKVQLQLVHKKVRLSDDLLAWEHERLSLKRLSAATISSLANHKEMRRSSLFMSKSPVNVTALARNVKVIAEGLARYMYNLADVDPDSSTSFFNGGANDVQEDFLRLWLRFLSRHARSPQLLNSEHPVVLGLQQALTRYTHEVTTFTHQPEKIDPEFIAYDQMTSKMVAYRVKPAIFDLFLAVGITLYASVWYFSVLIFPRLQAFITSILPFPVSIRVHKNKCD